VPGEIFASWGNANGSARSVEGVAAVGGSEPRLNRGLARAVDTGEVTGDEAGGEVDLGFMLFGRW
jgi:hypothetical protein